jgi:hypothetical protein
MTILTCDLWEKRQYQSSEMGEPSEKFADQSRFSFGLTVAGLAKITLYFIFSPWFRFLSVNIFIIGVRGAIGFCWGNAMFS